MLKTLTPVTDGSTPLKERLELFLRSFVENQKLLKKGNKFVDKFDIKRRFIQLQAINSVAQGVPGRGSKS